MNQTNSKTRILVEGALMVALATVLSYIKIFELPQGGTISLEMIPLFIMCFRHGTKWGLFTGFVHGFIQMILGFSNVLYCKTLVAQIGCVLLDYLVAFTVLGLAFQFAKLFGGRTVAGAAFGTFAACFLRFLCHFISGMWLWGEYAGGQAVWLYSAVYNGSYMLVDTVICMLCMALLMKAAPKLFAQQ
ncbi:MAG: energy-coupled thiamine transporter ThiT [Faecalibacterium sp.]|jgi:thiamine transporter|nr:energy-coupled thiamine transporter ThiT [Faecalibacterium sp.]